jgi:hypothetical protein
MLMKTMVLRTGVLAAVIDMTETIVKERTKGESDA